jgi:tetratricopeptide (TPR) repeat protein
VWILGSRCGYNSGMAERSFNEIARDARALFTKANECVTRENLDYAIDLFNQVLAKAPGFFEGRKALRAVQFQRAGSGGGFFKRMINKTSSSPQVAKGQLALHKDPAEALQIAEQILNNDPSNTGAHRLVVEAAKKMELPRTAVLSLEILAKHSPRDKDVAIELAAGLVGIGEAQRAERILSEMCRAFPNDVELHQALKDLSANRTLDEGGYEALADGSGSYRDILKDKDEAIALEQENRQIKSEDVTERLIRDYEGRLAKEPNNLKLIRSLAEFYTSKKEFERALSYYDRLKASDLGNDGSVDQAIAETVVRRYDHQISQLDTGALDHAERLAALQAEKQAYQLAECRKRVDRCPTDLGFRFEMGQLYFEAGKISEAIQEFQKAQASPHKRIAAMNLLAQCFAKRKMYDMAARTLQGALKEKIVFDDEKKELLYNLGCVLESMGKKAEAVEQFKLIYEVDIGYRDVAGKVDAFYAAQG